MGPKPNRLGSEPLRLPRRFAQAYKYNPTSE